MQSRYYDPEVGRFLNADDVDYIGFSGTEVSYNLFLYCENNPINGIDYWGNISLDSIKKFFEDLLNGLKNEIQNYLDSLIVLKNGRVHVSNSIISAAFDTIISIILIGKVYKTAEKVLGYFMEKIAKKEPTKIYNLLHTVLTMLKNKHILKFLVKKILKKFGLKSSLVSTVIDDFVSFFINNKVKILNKISVYASAFSSVGGFLAFIMDCTDGYSAADGYYTLRMLKYKEANKKTRRG